MATKKVSKNVYKSPKRKVTAQKTASSPTRERGSSFAPGSRPGVITRSGNTVFKDGKLVGNYNSKEAADKATAQFTSRRSDGRITNIAGDRGGETFRQMNRTNKGTQSGMANTGGIKSALKSRGFLAETGVDENGFERVTGAQTPQSVERIERANARDTARAEQIDRESQRAYVAGQPFSRQAPVLQDKTKEDEARARIAAERGIDTNNATASQRMLLNEAVNTDVYGTARPKFGTGDGVLSAGQKTQEQIIAGKKQAVFSIPENLKTGINETVVTSKGAEAFTEEQLAKFEDYNQENANEVTNAMDGLLQSDPDILAAEASGDDMQSLLEEQRSFYEEQYNQLKDEIQSIYDAKEADYEEQAAIAMGAAVSQMAAIGAFGVTTAGMRYVDGVSRENQAKILALASEEAAALNSAYSAFMQADFAVAEKMITTAKSTRDEIRTIKADQLARQKTLMELKQMEREDVGQTIEAIVTSGMTAEDLPAGYLEYLDQKSGYPGGTTAALMGVAEKEKMVADEAAQMEAFNTMLDTLPKLTPDQYIDYNGSRYYGKESSTEVVGTEIDKATGNIVTITRDKNTGAITTQTSKGVLTPNVSYSIQTDGDGKLWYVPDDPTQGSAIPVTGGQVGGAQGVNSGAIQREFPAGTTYAEYKKTNPDATVNDFWCLRFIGNMDVRGDEFINMVGDGIDAKAAAADPTISFENAQVGDYILTNEDSQYGHIALINDIRIDPETGKKVAVLTESNYKPLTVGHSRTIELSAENMARSGGAVMGFMHSQLKPEYTSQAPVDGVQLSTAPKSSQVTIDAYVTDYLRGAPLSSIPDDIRDSVVEKSSEIKSQYRDSAEITALNNIGNLSSDAKKQYEGNIIYALQNEDIGQAKQLVLSAVYDGADAETQRKLDGRAEVVDALTSVQNDLDSYYSSGGQTGIFAGTEEQIAAKIGKIKEPELRTIATKIQNTLINYRKAISGAAFTESEAAEYERLFPNIKNGPELNEIVIRSLIDTLEASNEGFYRRRIGDKSFNVIFEPPTVEEPTSSTRTGTYGTNSELDSIFDSIFLN